MATSEESSQRAIAAVQAAPTLAAAAAALLRLGGAGGRARAGAGCGALVDRWRAEPEWPTTAGANDDTESPPDHPPIDPSLEYCAPGRMPRAAQAGKGGSQRGRHALLHSLAHIECVAVDLALDAIARFGPSNSMPRAFYDDFVTVAEDERRHFLALAERLEGEPYKSHYGSLPVHDGLWQSATSTAHDPLARLAIEHMVHEARGLDVLPSTISKFRKGEDEATATLLETVVYPEEATHCAAGLRWFCYLVARETDAVDKEGAVRGTEGGRKEAHETPELREAARLRFVDIVPKYFRGKLKPPFNDEARAKAGFTPDWYLPLSVDAQAPTDAAPAAPVAKEDTVTPPVGVGA